MSSFKIKLGRPEKIMLANIDDRERRREIKRMMIENIVFKEQRRRAKNTVLDPTPGQEVANVETTLV